MNPQQIKIKAFDEYVMSGGNKSLQSIEDLCDYGFDLCGVGHDSELFQVVVIDVIRKLTRDLKK